MFFWNNFWNIRLLDLTNSNTKQYEQMAKAFAITYG